MKQYFPRCNLPRRHERHAQHDLRIPPAAFADHACRFCGERSAYCTHRRKDNTFVCENCYRKRNVVTIAKKKQWLWDHKASVGCVRCKENDPRCLDYHHLNEKKKKFSIGSIASSIPDHAVIIEMKKCVVICANCHRQVEIAKSHSE